MQRRPSMMRTGWEGIRPSREVIDFDILRCAPGALRDGLGDAKLELVRVFIGLIIRGLGGYGFWRCFVVLPKSASSFWPVPGEKLRDESR